MTPSAHIAGLLPALPFVLPMLVVVAFLAQLTIRDRLQEKRAGNQETPSSPQPVSSTKPTKES